MSSEVEKEIETHPFDLSFEAMEKIKMHFPEYQIRHEPGLWDQPEYNVKAPGILLTDLKEVIWTNVFMTIEDIDKMFSQMDNHSDERITWTEFMEFLWDVGDRRNVANATVVWTEGNTMITEGKRSKIRKEENKAIDFIIDQVLLIDIGGPKHLVSAVAVLENRETILFKLSNFGLTYRFPLEFKFTAPKLKEKKEKKEKGRNIPNQPDISI